MSTVYAAAWAYCLPPERTGTPPAGWPSRRLQDGLATALQQSGQGTLNAVAAHRLSVE
jgi:hypothetical protein